jgi:hypothetical protein
MRKVGRATYLPFVPRGVRAPARGDLAIRIAGRVTGHATAKHLQCSLTVVPIPAGSQTPARRKV